MNNSCEYYIKCLGDCHGYIHPDGYIIFDTNIYSSVIDFCKEIYGYSSCKLMCSLIICNNAGEKIHYGSIISKIMGNGSERIKNLHKYLDSHFNAEPRLSRKIADRYNIYTSTDNNDIHISNGELERNICHNKLEYMLDPVADYLNENISTFSEKDKLMILYKLTKIMKKLLIN